ncbi:cupin domain-containing protein [Paenalkalicoccus suaedae]|uniref:Cupin domain-containing protein n=1 Tax=Paenalkalicoccus suaedae TaxID=2592382 RepID=A0A859FAZ3_9BACI|nr:cupin domain-containing protein [Paenalkalicoccus suaedae]QKS70523.1 cupin domain-containing protein [Paenalkalicoccus suaedae]
MASKEYYLNSFEMIPHPEGGYYKEIERSTDILTLEDGRVRPAYTSIHFLLTKESPSKLHRLKSDEVWYFHDGSPLTVHMITPDGDYVKETLQSDGRLQLTVPKGTIFGSSVETDFAFVSCMVSPGFDFEDFELFTKADLLPIFPEHEEVIKKLT